MSRKWRNCLIGVLVVAVLAAAIWLLGQGPSDFRQKYEGTDLSTDVSGLGRGNTYDAYLASHAGEAPVKEEVPVVVIPDHAAASCLARQGANVVMTDGILAAKNGDLKAPVGSYELAIACYFHSIPFYAVMNADDIDLDIPSGDAFGKNELPQDLAAPGLDCGSAERWCPAYDVVPAFLITGYLTDRGIASAPYEETLDKLVKNAPKKLILNFDA